MSSAFVAVLVLLALVVPVGLWLLIESETDETSVMDRESAERSARADARDPPDHRRRD